jgi:hypothetical protein
MGGMGSGRGLTGKAMTHERLSVDVRRMQRERLLKPGLRYSLSWMRGERSLATVEVRTDLGLIGITHPVRNSLGEWEPMKYEVVLDWMECHFGGRRAWFRCPVLSCNRRVAILYRSRPGLLCCRHCNRLVYACQREDEGDRAMRQVDKIRRKLGWPQGYASPNGDKPKGMHWRTYARLTSELRLATEAAMAGLDATIERVRQQVERLERSLRPM